MSRLIDNQIWNARSFTNLSVKGKLLYLYLETSPETNYYGVFLLPNNNVISARTGVETDKIQEVLEYLEKHNKIKLIGDYLIIFDYFKKQKGKLTQKHLTGLENFKRTLPPEVLTAFEQHLGNGYSMGIDRGMNGDTMGMDKSKVKESKVKEKKEKESKVENQPDFSNQKSLQNLKPKIQNLNLEILKENSLKNNLEYLKDLINSPLTINIFDKVLDLDNCFDYILFIINQKVGTVTFELNKQKVNYWTEVWYKDYLETLF